MGWFAIDDQFPFNVKVLCAGNAAVGAWVRLGAWSAGQLTDGFVPADVARQIASAAELRSLERAPAGTERGMIVRVDGGWLLPDYLDFNPTAASVKARRDRERERIANKRSGVARNTDATSGQHRGRLPSSTRQVVVSPTPTPVSTTCSDIPTTMYPADGGGAVDNRSVEVVSRIAGMLLAREPEGVVRNPEGWLVNKRRQLAYHHGESIKHALDQGESVDEVVAGFLAVVSSPTAPPRPDDTGSAVRYGRSRALNERADEHDPLAFQSEVEAMGVSEAWQQAAVAAYCGHPSTSPDTGLVDRVADVAPVSAPVDLTVWKSQNRGVL
jgi:hypothetical protein